MARPSPAIAGTVGVRIVHDIPGRLRLRLADAIAPEDVLDAVRALDGVVSVAWSPLTRSMLVRYAPTSTTASGIVEAAHEAAALDPPVPAPLEDRTVDQPVTLADAVVASASELDRRVRASTRGVLGLGGLVPLTLALWAVREIAFGRTQPLAWSTALWYAHGLFRDYNTPSS